MKQLKKIAAAAFLGFLAFAPPGTLIFIGVLLLSVLGKTWFFVGLAVGLVSLAVYGFIYREKLSKINFVKNVRRRFRE
jgi:high-affinity Fe2+/Pb2+ permease